jgi:integrase
MLDLAKSRSRRDYILLTLMRYGLRVGEIVGWRGLPGIHPEDLREQSIWVKGKGYERGIVQDIEYPVPVDLLTLIRQYAQDCRTVQNKKIFPLSEPWTEQIVKWYARQVGVEDWQLVGPHRLRAFFNTDMRSKGIDLGIRTHMMRHKNVKTTMIYDDDLELSEKQKVLQKIADK